MKTALELEYQLDGIDYEADNFVHADLDVESFFKLQSERGESMLSLMLSAMRVELAKSAEERKQSFGLPQMLAALLSEDTASALKYFLAREMQNMEAVLSGLEDGNEKGSVIITERNRKALAVLKERINAGERRLAIFYGAGHMPDLEARVLGENFLDGKFKIERAKLEWLPAWTIVKKKPGSSRKEAPREGQRETVLSGRFVDVGAPGAWGTGPASRWLTSRTRSSRWITCWMVVIAILPWRREEES